MFDANVTRISEAKICDRQSKGGVWQEAPSQRHVTIFGRACQVAPYTVGFRGGFA